LKKTHKENTVGPWAKQKLDGLESYLHHYLQVLEKFGFKVVYIDAFAGAGKSEVRNSWKGADDDDLLLFDDDFVQSEAEFIEGSPRRALGLKYSFHGHYFFDQDPVRAKLLEDLQSEFPEKNIYVRVGDANPLIQKLAKKLRGRDTRGFAFLDPYGPHLHWDTIKSLVETKNVEVMINFPLGMAVNRMIKRNGDIPENCRHDLNLCFGTNEWEPLVYNEQRTLFGTTDRQKVDNTAARLLGLYVDRLKNYSTLLRRRAWLEIRLERRFTTCCGRGRTTLASRLPTIS